MKTPLIDPIEQIFESISNSSSSPSLELFNDSRKGDISLKTDLTHKEHVLVSALSVENSLINESLKDFDLYGKFLEEFKRHKLSLDRKSRNEFVESNKKPSSSDLLNEASSVKNLTESRK